MNLVSASPLLSHNERDRIIEHWFDQHHQQLLRYLLRLTGDESESADLLQETFLRAFNALAKQPPPDYVFAWLYRIATNLAFNALRRQRRFRWLPLGNDDYTTTFEGDVAVAQQVRRCLARLKPADAEALLLIEYAGLSCVEVAAQTGEEPATVRARVHRARQRFRALYEQEQEA